MTAKIIDSEVNSEITGMDWIRRSHGDYIATSYSAEQLRGIAYAAEVRLWGKVSPSLDPEKRLYDPRKLLVVGSSKFFDVYFPPTQLGSSPRG